MSQLPPPQFPPPQPAPVPKKQLRPWQIALIVIGALSLIVVGKLGPKSHTGNGGAPGYSVSGGVCTSDGYSIHFTNRGKREWNGTVWAVMKQGGTVVDRDKEIVLGLAPNATTTLDFTMFASGSNFICKVESAEWKYGN